MKELRNLTAQAVREICDEKKPLYQTGLFLGFRERITPAQWEHLSHWTVAEAEKHAKADPVTAGWLKSYREENGEELPEEEDIEVFLGSPLWGDLTPSQARFGVLVQLLLEGRAASHDVLATALLLWPGDEESRKAFAGEALLKVEQCILESQRRK